MTCVWEYQHFANAKEVGGCNFAVLAALQKQEWCVTLSSGKQDRNQQEDKERQDGDVSRLKRSAEWNSSLDKPRPWKRETPTENYSDRYLALYAVTLTDVYEFKVTWKYWFCFTPSKEAEKWAVAFDDEATSDDEGDSKLGNDFDLQWEMKNQHARDGMDNFLGWTDKSAEEIWRDNMDNAAVNQREKAIQSGLPGWVAKLIGKVDGEEHDMPMRRMALAEKNLLTKSLKRKIMGIKQVAFSPAEEPIMELGFKNKKSVERETGEALEIVKIAFTNDTLRERFKRFVAFALNKTDDANLWMRTWKDTNNTVGFKE